MLWCKFRERTRESGAVHDGAAVSGGEGDSNFIRGEILKPIVSVVLDLSYVYMCVGLREERIFYSMRNKLQNRFSVDEKKKIQFL